MIPRKFSFCFLLGVLILLYNLNCITADNQEGAPNIDLANVGEGGAVSKGVKEVFSIKVAKSTPSTPLHRKKDLSANNDTTPTQENTHNVSKQIEKPTNVVKPAKIVTVTNKTTENPGLIVPVLPGNITKGEKLPPKNVTSTPRPKPLLTVHDDDPDKPEMKPDANVQEMPSIIAIKKKNNRANYVIPIVAVILSVPLLAIIISVVYKRGADWWQHRNYRRMDFLIEGMYNN